MEEAAREIPCFHPRCPIGSNEPHQVIPRQGCISVEPASVSPGLVVPPGTYEGKRYWPLSWRMSPCWEAWVMASCAVRFEQLVRCMISSRSWL
jgi:hypothetical protein